MYSHRLCGTFAAAATVSVFGLNAAQAQEATIAGPSAQAEALQEITVTAEKRAEKLGDVPISIAVYNTEEMDLRGIRDIKDIATVTPGVIYTENGAFNNISIRGITSTATAGASLAALYVDDVPVQVRTGLGAFATDLPQIFDLDRVEVLRGPQGTLFGASAMGGAIRFISPEPSLTDYSGYVRSEVAETKDGALSDEAGVAYGGPIVKDELGFRLSAWHRTDGGYINHESYLPGGADQTNANSTDRYTARGALTFAPTSTVRLTASVFVQEVNDNDLGKFYPVASDPSAGKFVETDLLLNPVRDRFVVPSFKIAADLGWADFASNTGYVNRHFLQYVDYTTVIPAALGQPAPTSANDYQQLGELTSQNTFVQELRLNSPANLLRWKWTVGAYYSDARQNGVETIAAPTFPGALVNGLYSYDAGENFDDEEVAGFGNLEYSFAHGLSVLAGVRVSSLTDRYFSQGAGPLFGAARTVVGLNKATPITPKFGINYKLNQDNLLYVSAAKGYRVGGSNAPITIPNDACQAQLNALGLNGNPTYKPDSLWSYEIGSKNNLLGGRLAVDASIFHIDWTNIQRTVQIPVCTAGLTLNLGNATSDGFDLALDGRLTDHLKTSLEIGYTAAKTAKTVTFSGVQYAAKGEQISDYPPWTTAIALEYDFEIAREHNEYLRVENRYNAKNNGSFSFLNPANTGAYNQTQGIDASVEDLIFRAGIMRGGFDLSMFVNNVTNQHALLAVVTTQASSAYGAETIRPLTVGLTGVYHW
jgi:iron complex outermembrane receptor protein